MRIHEEGASHKSEAHCGYCRKKGHNQYDCPKVKEDWAFFAKYQIPNDGQGNITPTGWYRYPRDWGSWYEHCQKTYNEIIKREKAATSPLGKPKRAQRTCGFCGSKDHTRRNCTKMDMFLKDCHEANIKWRKAAYKELVGLHGVSVGAAVIVNEEDRWHTKGNVKLHNGIITSINWNKINVFTALKKRHDDAYSPIMIAVMLSDGQTITINHGFTGFNCLDEGATPRTWGNRYSLRKVVAPSKTPLSEEWITGYKESFKTLVKKRSLEQLRHGLQSSYNQPDLIAHIKAWK
tara:strand:- start:2664 stop:3536 length:873 start_codon:yes stop_codon:yes gene_type:complete